MNNLKELKAEIQTGISGANGVLANFRDGLDTNPERAMSWSISAFSAAAATTVGRQMIARLGAIQGAQDYMTTSEKLGVLLTRISSDVVIGARSTESSSSSTSNIMKREILRAWAEMATLVESYIDA